MTVYADVLVFLNGVITYFLLLCVCAFFKFRPKTYRLILGAVLGAGNSEIAKIFSQYGFSRLPIYKESIDNIIGTINEKDFYKKVYNRSTPVDEIICEPFFIPASMKISDLLKELQRRQYHLAIITDEYGGTKGIVTMEDILEELVGEIWDEHDKVIKEITEIGENKYSVICSMDFEVKNCVFSLLRNREGRINFADSSLVRGSRWLNLFPI